jgi:hypothetical protein
MFVSRQTAEAGSRKFWFVETKIIRDHKSIARREIFLSGKIFVTTKDAAQYGDIVNY